MLSRAARDNCPRSQRRFARRDSAPSPFGGIASQREFPPIANVQLSNCAADETLVERVTKVMQYLNLVMPRQHDFLRRQIISG